MDQRNAYIPISDIEKLDQQQEVFDNALNAIGDALGHASGMLDDVERDGVLGPAIKRCATDLATLVGNVARDLDCTEENEEERRRWARALLNDAQSQLALEVGNGDYGNGDGKGQVRLQMQTRVRIQSQTQVQGKLDNANNSSAKEDNDDKFQSPQSEELVNLNDKSAAAAIVEYSEEDIIDAMSAARLILLDVEEALRNISADEAEEIADVALTVAQMFLWGLKNIQSQIVNKVSDQGDYNITSSSIDNTMGIEIIDDEDDEVNSNKGQNDRQRKSTLREDRLRVLWPPVGPAVISVASWGKDEAVKHPILSIAMAMALWPTAIIVAFIGTPILAVDFALQSGYNALEDQPILKNVERGAANLCQVGKLYYLVSKLMVKQSIRVGKRQLQRRGGVGKVAEGVGHWTVDRIMHPVQTAGMAWNTFRAGAGIVKDVACFMKDVATGDIKVKDIHLDT
jgi:hypothetical protein